MTEIGLDPELEQLRTSRGSNSVPNSHVQMVVMFSGIAMMMA
ncbi:hypothetical protein [Paraburkholderia oxyphila]|nr:hypothetical protein [Paraburkholderia oxyphila]